MRIDQLEFLITNLTLVENGKGMQLGFITFFMRSMYLPL